MRTKLVFYSSLLLALHTTPALAYIGPGLGAGAIAVVLGVIASIFMAFLAIFWYPIKRLLRQKKARGSSEAEDPEVQSSTDSQPVENRPVNENQADT